MKVGRTIATQSAEHETTSPMSQPVTSADDRGRRRAIITGVALLVVLVGGAALYLYADRLIERRLRPATIELLEKRFDGAVELASVRATVVPSLGVRGEGLVVRHQGRTDIPPLISIRAFTISSSVLRLWRRDLDRVHLDGLEIIIPPRRGEDMPALTRSDDADADDDGPDVFIGEILTENSLLTIMPKETGKQPRVFQLRRLRFEDFQFARPTPFEAELTNPTPEGEIAVVGAFGPWHGEQPGLTPIEGNFTFDADLGTINGIGGDLRAEGVFSGPLDYIRTSGKTRTEGFHLSSGSAKFPLVVDYDAIVDGTNGDTRLERVEGTLGRSRVSARGAIVHVEGRKGRRITLDTSTTDGRIEDFIRLTTRVPSSPLTGAVTVKAKLDIPPGEPEVIERMTLDGTFALAAARFTSDEVQDRVDELSRRGRGTPKDDSIDDVASNMRGSFRMSDGRMTLRSLSFSVQGAEVRLAGSYDVASEALDFAGTLRLQARMSKTQTGWKSFVLRLFDPLFDGDGAGTVLPITVSGTRDEPEFKVDVKKALLPGK
jgi:hypothetical protein